MNISKGKVDDHCYFSTMEKGELMFLILDQKNKPKQLKYYKKMHFP